MASWARVSTDTTIDIEVAPRQRGEPLIPFARADAVYRWVNGGVSGFDGRGELGYAWAGLEARYTSYWDRKTKEFMSTTVVEPRLRMSYGSHVEVDLGFGLFLLDGDRNHVGTSFSLPVLIHPSPYYGLEYRPTWCALEGNTVRDHTLSARLGWRYVGLLAGYRWVQSGTAALNGPHLGLSLAW